MLVLSMNLNSGPIHLTDKTTNEHTEIQLLGISKGQIRIGFSASDNIEILRDKLYWTQEDQGNE